MKNRRFLDGFTILGGIQQLATRSEQPASQGALARCGDAELRPKFHVWEIDESSLVVHHELETKDIARINLKIGNRQILKNYAAIISITIILSIFLFLTSSKFRMIRNGLKIVLQFFGLNQR